MAYNGGKGAAGVYQRLINLMPPHETYIEPFLGGGAVLLNKRPARRSIGLDLDAKALARWRGDEVPGLHLCQQDALTFLREYAFTGDELVYCDPPYLMETRSYQRRLYRCEMTVSQHKELLAILRDLPCAVIISGYFSLLYAEELAGWRTMTYQAIKRQGGMATECVWLNFPPPLELHDYRYLGSDFRERGRIKRKQDRWKARLLRMPELERMAVLAALSDLRAGGPI